VRGQRSCTVYRTAELYKNKNKNKNSLPFTVYGLQLKNDNENGTAELYKNKNKNKK